MWLSEFEIVLRDRVIPSGAIRIENGRIAEIRNQPVENADISGGGRLLLPGFIDMHGDMVEKEGAGNIPRRPYDLQHGTLSRHRH